MSEKKTTSGILTTLLIIAGFVYVFRTRVKSNLVNAQTVNRSITNTINLNQSMFSKLTLDLGSFNFEGTFYAFDVKSQGYVSAFRKLNVNTLRFPGGTIANFYHYGAPGYGVRISEFNLNPATKMYDTVSRIFTKNIVGNENYLDTYTRFAKGNSFKTIFVLNLLTADIDENLQVIKRLIDAGVVIKAFELGNEFYLDAYSNQYPSCNEYLAHAANFAKKLKSKYPTIPIIAVGDSRDLTSGKISYWNNSLALQNWYDGVTMHYYPITDECLNYTSANDASTCIINKTSTSIDQKYDVNVPKLVALFDNRPLWITEYNVLPTTLTGGSIVQALTAANFALKNLKINQDVSGAVANITYHVLSVSDGLFSLINDIGSPQLDLTPAYYFYQFLSPIFKGNWTYSIQEQENLKIGYFFNGNSFFALILNQTGNTVPYQICKSIDNGNYTMQLHPSSAKVIGGKSVALFALSSRSTKNMASFSDLNVNPPFVGPEVLSLTKIGQSSPYSITKIDFTLL